MARVKIEVDRKLLFSCIQEVEKDGPLTNQNLLWEAVAELYNKQAKVPITPAVVGLRAKEWSIPLKTVPGKRGRQKGSGNPAFLAAARAAKGPRKSRGEKFAGNASIADHNQQLIQIVPASFRSLAERAAKGSMKAAVVLHCVQCTGYDRKSVKHCTSNGSCPLWAYRPYQGVDDEVEDAVAV